MSLFDNCDGLWQNAVKVDKELQFNSWLFDGMKTDLKPRGFHVEANRLNRAIVPSVCEYSNSICDCVIYHPNTLFKTNIDALAIVIHDDSSERNSSDSDMNIEDLDELDKITVHGSTFKMKSDTVSQAAINESINDMFGTGFLLGG